VAALKEIKDLLDRAGIPIVAIGSGSFDQARTFADGTEFPGELYVSPDLAAYSAFGLARGRLRTLGPQSFLRALRALKRGFRQGSTAGDNWQQGGVFLLGPGREVFLEHRNRFAGDFVDKKYLSAALEPFLYQLK